MKIWNKIKDWYHKRTHKVCPFCKIEQHKIEFVHMWLNGECNSCYWENHFKLEKERKNKEREARIEEMAEAIRRAGICAAKK